MNVGVLIVSVWEYCLFADWSLPTYSCNYVGLLHVSFVVCCPSLSFPCVLCLFLFLTHGCSLTLLFLCPVLSVDWSYMSSCPLPLDVSSVSCPVWVLDLYCPSIFFPLHVIFHTGKKLIASCVFDALLILDATMPAACCLIKLNLWTITGGVSMSWLGSLWSHPGM